MNLDVKFLTQIAEKICSVDQQSFNIKNTFMLKNAIKIPSNYELKLTECLISTNYLLCLYIRKQTRNMFIRASLYNV